jgi:HemY protein
MRALPALLAFAVLVACAVFIADRPGSVAITWQGWRIDTSVAVLVLGTVVFAVGAAMLWSVLRFIIGGPRAFLRARRERRRQQGYRALTQGMVAVAAGDAEEAQKLARKADALLAEPPLTLLLSAQAAQLSGDEAAAARYFTAMLDRPETEFLGLRGLFMQALRGGDEAGALRLAERAKVLRPRTPWVLSHLLELQARAGSWPAAEATLLEAARRKTLPAAESKHRHAVLLHEHAVEAEAQERAGEAMRLIAKAYSLAPSFAPIAARYARMLNARGQRRRARRALEAAWRAAPHPLLASGYAALFADEAPLARMKRAARLASYHPAHEESRLALAQAALDAKLWGEARRHLADLGAHNLEDSAALQPRVCRMMAALAESEHGDHAAARDWLARAATSELLDPTWHCSSCGVDVPNWSAICPACRGFDTLGWRAQGHAAQPRQVLEAPAVGLVALPHAVVERGGGASP